MRRLTVLYDGRCGFCVRCRRWLQAQRQLVTLEFVPAGSADARSRFPTLADTPAEELIVVSDEGGVYRGTDAWIMCLYALEEYREWSVRLARPALRPMARAAFEWLSRNRRELSQRLRFAAEEEVAAVLSPLEPARCTPRRAGEQAIGVTCTERLTHAVRVLFGDRV
jgi:predicted DCC family thiol-disulfide oxidoreductase YuxK